MRTEKKESFFLGGIWVYVFGFFFFFFFFNKTRYREKQREANEIWARTGKLCVCGEWGLVKRRDKFRRLLTHPCNKHKHQHQCTERNKDDKM